MQKGAHDACRKPSRRRAGGLAIAVLGFGVAACAGDDAGSETSAPPEWRVAETASVSIGVLEGDEAYVLSRVADVVLLDDGGVAVADGGSSTVRVYGSDGRIRRVSGGPGQGPGEYAWMNDLRYLPPDTLVVFDSDIGRLTELAELGGSVSSTVTFRAPEGRVEVYLGRFPDGSHALAWIDQQQLLRDADGIAPDPMSVARFGPDGALRTSLGDAVGMRRLARRPTPFSPHFQGAVVGSLLLYGDGIRARLLRTAPSGEPAAPLDFDLPPTGLDDALAAYLTIADSGDVARLEEIRGTAGLDSVPAFSSLLVDDTGRPWLKSYDPRTDSHWIGRPRTGGGWLVLEADGTPVARVSVPDGFRLMDVRGDAVAGVSRDELGVERVEVRRLERGGG